MGRKRDNWEENGKLAGSLPLRTGRAGYGPVIGPKPCKYDDGKSADFHCVVCITFMPSDRDRRGK